MTARRMRLGLSIRGHGYHPAAWRHPDVPADGTLHVYANGEMTYRIRGVHARVSVLWNYEAPAGAGHYRDTGTSTR